MNVCFFGGWDKKYSRNKVLEKALKKQEVNIIECWEAPPKWNPVLFKELPFFIFENIWRSIKLFFKHSKCKYDILLVPFPCYYDVPLAKFLSKFRKKKVVFDFFISKYITLILDHKCDSEKSLKAKLLKYYDEKALRSSDKNITDTKQHLELFSK